MNKKSEAIILAIMCFLLTIAVYVQIKTVNNNGATVGLSQTESELKTQVLKIKEKYPFLFWLIILKVLKTFLLISGQKDLNIKESIPHRNRLSLIISSGTFL